MSVDGYWPSNAQAAIGADSETFGRLRTNNIGVTFPETHSHSRFQNRPLGIKIGDHPRRTNEQIAHSASKSLIGLGAVRH